MTKAKLFIGFIVIIGAMLSSAAPAFAEFESIEGTTQGKAELAGTVLEAGGGIVTCHGLTEESNRAKWTIKNEKEAATKGSRLVINAEKFGECQVKSAKVKEEKAFINSCEMEIKQPGEEETVPLTVDTTCTVVTGLCEIKMEAEGNKALKGTVITSNAILQPKITGVTTTAKGCESLGITGSKEGKLTAAWEAQAVQAAPRPELIIGSTRLFFTKLNNTGSLTVINAGRVQTPRGWIRFELSFPSLLPAPFATTGEATCKAKTYLQTESCIFTTERKLVGFQVLAVQSFNRGWSGVLLRSS